LERARPSPGLSLAPQGRATHEAEEQDHPAGRSSGALANRDPNAPPEIVLLDLGAQ
jgi:hypothetical protein